MNSEELEVIDVEQFAIDEKVVPKKRKYRIRIDREKKVVDSECLTGREILELVDKAPPKKYQLNQKFRNGQVKKIDYDETVCFTAPGVERFMTLPIDQTEG